MVPLKDGSKGARMTIAEWGLLAAVLIYLLTIAPFKPFKATGVSEHVL